MRIKVRLLGQTGHTAGTSSLQVELAEGSDLRALLEALTSEYGEEFTRSVLREDGDVWASVALLVNGTSAWAIDGISSRLRDGDVVTILPVVGGG